MKFLPPEQVPYHLAIIMDGNGRWAKARGKPRHEGHRAGTENVRRILRLCSKLGVKILTLYAFSTENWGRPPAEVAFLMRILESVIDREVNDLNANGIQIRHIGNLDELQTHLARKILNAVEMTRNNDRLILNLAFNYGGRDEIVRAVRRIVADGLSPDEINEDVLAYYLSTAGQADPDLIIRTSGEMRVSNFLIWQGAYAEYLVTPVYWPDFTEDELYAAFETYGQRERRFGMVKAAP